MFSDKLNKTAKRHGGIPLVSPLLFLVLLILFCPYKSYATTDPDSTKQKYDLFDPRNPDCPCHAAQKQAEEEYKKLQAQNNVNGNGANNTDDAANKNKMNPADGANTGNNNQNNTNVNTTKNISGTSSGGSSKHYSKSNRSLKQMNKWMKKMKRQMGKKNNGTKKGKRRLASCFHFN